jgi:beta-glucosidase
VPPLLLPPGFRLGTAASAYQIEGAVAEDGRGRSIWEPFSETWGRVRDGSTGARAADHYHRLAEDTALLKQLGVRSHRFSLSWSRVLPEGRGTPNARGLDFYDRMIDGLLEAGIDPVATLYSYDLPQALEDDGGWLNRATIEAFAEYAALVGTRFADRVSSWIPIQEPNVAAFLGYATGQYAPGRSLVFDALPAVHHMLVGHGRAAIALRGAGATVIGCANNHSPMWPLSEDPADVGATKLFDALWNGWFLEAMLLGRYPRDLAPLVEEVMVDGDLATMRQPLDFYGVNFYHPRRVGAAAEGSDMPFDMFTLVGHPETEAGFPAVPSALREFLILLRARFRAALPPIVITECGAAYGMGPDERGVVDDQPRIDFLESHLTAVKEAIDRGVDVRGFYAHTLLDGWDWDNGFSQRYGMVHVDFDTLVRTPKRSFQWYADVIAAQPTVLA